MEKPGPEIAHMICRHHEASQAEYGALFVAWTLAVYKGTDATEFIEIGEVHGLSKGSLKHESPCC